MSARTEDVPADEFDEYLSAAFRDPAFVVAYELARIKDEMCHQHPLAINGREYRRRQLARGRHRR